MPDSAIGLIAGDLRRERYGIAPLLQVFGSKAYAAHCRPIPRGLRNGLLHYSQYHHSQYVFFYVWPCASGVNE